MFSYSTKSLKFEELAREFETQFKDNNDRSAQLAVSVDNEIILDVTGIRNEHCSMDLSVIFSSTKVIESLIVAMLVDSQKLDYDTPIANYWPEFGTIFNKTVTVVNLMQHRAGLEQIPIRTSTPDTIQTFSTLAGKEQWVLTTLKMDEDVKQGECKSRYHPVTRGIIVDILCERVSGMNGSTFVQEEILSKLDNVEFYIGCPNQEVKQRVATCEPSQSQFSALLEYLFSGLVNLFKHPGKNATKEELNTFHYHYLKPEEIGFTKKCMSKHSMEFQSLMLVNDKGFGTHTLANSADFFNLSLLSVTGITNAKSFARILSELADETSTLFLSKEGRKRAFEVDNDPIMDEMLGVAVSFTKCGWSMDYFKEGWIGWAGAGGSLAVFSTKCNASFVYIPTKLDMRIHKPQAMKLLDRFTTILTSFQ